MPCDKRTQGLEGIGFWDFLRGDFFPEEESLYEPGNSDGSRVSDVWYYYRIDPATQNIQYQFPPSNKWINTD